MTMAKVGLLFETETLQRRWRYGINNFQLYLKEILGHAGIPFEVIDRIDQISGCDIIVAGLTEDTPDRAEALRQFAEQGGAVIAYGGLNKLADRLGCVRLQATGVGYANLPDQEAPVRYLQAEVWEPKDPGACRATGTLRRESPEGPVIGPAMLRFQVGEGSIQRWAVDAVTAIVTFQQGTGPVLEDGVPARDGTANLAENILKADDCCAMDWELDRQRTATGEIYYAHPYADYWREAIIAQLLRTAVEQGKTLPFVDLWPEGVEQVAMISFDSDLNIDEAALKTLEALKASDVPSTWCLIEPGFSEPVLRKAESEGHELALHYNALEQDNGVWGSKEFKRQFEWVKKATGKSHITSNKNHYTRFEGWDELFLWCEACGIQADQTRGPSKKGNVGFLFGTCHPYFPIGWFHEENRFFNVLELGFLTQDMNHHSLTDDSIAVPFLEQVKKVKGLAHFLFHQVHILQQEPVRQALANVAREAKRRGFVFWTSAQVNEWERSRRSVIIRGVNAEGNAVVEARTLSKDAVVWIPVTAGQGNGDTELRYGVPCVKQVVSAARPANEGVTVNG